MTRGAAICMAALLLAGSLSGCGRHFPSSTPDTAPTATSTPAPYDAFADLDAIDAATAQTESDIAEGETAENTTDAP